MPRQDRYKFDTDISPNDYTFGYDIASSKNRNYTFASIANFVGAQESVAGRNFIYTFDKPGAPGTMTAGEFTTNNRAANPTTFSAITNFYFHIQTYHS